MIVKNGSSTLARCFESVSPFIDRIIIGDTGSADATPEIARRFGAEVVEIPWEQDFARARNRVLALSKCDWILVLDADEMLDSHTSPLIEELTARRDMFAYDVWRWNYIREAHSRSGEQAPLQNPFLLEASRPYPAYVLSLNTRLFRRHPGIYFEHCVHETVSGRLDALGLAKSQAKFVIHHLGHVEDSDQVRQGKNELYQKLGLNKLKALPTDHRAHFELGLGEFEHYRRPASALAYFERACELNPQHAPSSLFAGICLIRMGRPAEALARLHRAHTNGLRSPILYESIGDAYFHSGQYVNAREAYERAIAAGGISPLCSAKLGASEVHLGLVDQGLRRMQEAVDANGEFGELYDILVAGALLGGNLPLAAQAAEARLKIGKPRSSHFQLAAALQARLGNHSNAQVILRRGRDVFPDDSELWQQNQELRQQL